MTAEKFVLRLLDAEGHLLAWATVMAEPRPQARGGSCPFFATTETVLVAERDGRAVETTIHWCDLDVARREQLAEPLDVLTGQQLRFAWLQPVWLVPGMRDVPLPAVTVREPVAVTVPTGNLTATL